VKAEAARLGIRLYFIPAGFTDELQPLDRYVFGVLKAMCRRMFHRFTEVVNDTVRKPDAVEFMVAAWEEVDENVMRKEWGIYEGPCDDGDLPMRIFSWTMQITTGSMKIRPFLTKLLLSLMPIRMNKRN
jgi:hypothetical protein